MSTSPYIAIGGNTFPEVATVLTDRLPDATVRVLTQAELLNHAGAIDIVVPTLATLPRAFFERAVRLRLVQQWGAGLSGVDLAAATDHGIPVANVPSIRGNASAVAEWSVMTALMLARRMDEARMNLERGENWGLPIGDSLSGSTTGILGFGGVGAAVAGLLAAFDAVVVIGTRDPSKPRPLPHNSTCFNLTTFLTMLAQFDFLFVCLPSTPETRDFVTRDVIGQLREGCHLVIASRAEVVARDALLCGAQEGQLGGVALDVFWSEPVDPLDPVLALPNVVATPHIGGSTRRAYEMIGEQVILNIRRVLAGEPPDCRENV